MRYRDDKAYREFKNKLSRVFNDADLWSCESCHWADKDDRICMICDRISRAFLWVGEVERILGELKEMEVEIIDERDVKEFIVDRVIGTRADLTLYALANAVKDYRKVFGIDRKIKLEVHSDAEIPSWKCLLLSIACHNEHETEKFEEIRGKYRGKLSGDFLEVHITPLLKKEGFALKKER